MEQIYYLELEIRVDKLCILGIYEVAKMKVGSSELSCLTPFLLMFKHFPHQGHNVPKWLYSEDLELNLHIRSITFVGTEMSA